MRQEQGGLLPDASFVTSQDHGDHVLPTPGTARNQAMAGGVGVAGLHPIAERICSENAIRILQRDRLSARVSKHAMLRPHNLAQERIEIGGSGDSGHVARRRILVIRRQAVGIYEM